MNIQKKSFFDTNPQKSANKVTINSFMMGSLFFILTLIITLDPNKFSLFVIYQLVLAIPLLFVSSLAYSKVGYYQHVSDWDTLGWFTNTMGNLFIINAIGLLTSKFDKTLALLYFLLFLILMIVYTYFNIKHNKEKLGQKLFKLLFLIVIIVLGGVLLI